MIVRGPREHAAQDSVSAPEGHAHQDFTVFVWFLALAALFQLARGDMGLIPSWRDTPNGETLGDGLVPQIWFCCALLALAFPTRVWSVTLLSLAGLFDFWWRLPIVTPSLYFHALVSAQVVLTAGWLLIRGRRLRVSPAEFIETVRAPLLLMVIGLFGFAAFHKLTYESRAWSGGFFHTFIGYYLPFPSHLVSVSLGWLVTVVGELSIALALVFQRTRRVGLLLCLGFACFVGAVVYGFGAIVLASSLPLTSTRALFAPLRSVSIRERFSRLMPVRWYHMAFALGIGALFLVDHVRGFTLADRAPLFERGKAPTTSDVLTLMQWAWFILTTPVLVSALMNGVRPRSAIVARVRFDRRALTYAVPVFLVVSEIGLYAGLKDAPGFTMFSAMRVKSCQPNHYVARDYILSSFFHRDLMVVTTPEGERIAMPALSLAALSERARRHGIHDPLVDAYRTSPVTRLRGGIEEPARFEDLEHIKADSALEVLLPRRLFFLRPASEADLRCSMPDLFKPVAPSAASQQRAD